MSTSLRLDELNGINGFSITGLALEDLLGFDVSTAGDVNNDGIDDLLIGAPGVDAANPDPDDFEPEEAGAAYVIYGNNNIGAGGSFDLTALDGSNGFVTNQSSFETQTGYKVSNAGDLNNDGIDDFAVASLTTIYVLFGGNTIAPTGLIDITDLDGANGIVIAGDFPENSNVFLGIPISSIGDVNNDGIDDLLIGAPDSSGNSGKSYVVFGQSDFSATPFIDLEEFEFLDGSNGFVIDEPDDFSSDSRGLGYSVSGSGDFNGDGISDFIIGSTGDSFAEGYVIFGADDLGSTGTFDIESLDGTNGFNLKWAENAFSSNYGLSVSNLGDFNGDGFDDLAIAGPDQDDPIVDGYVVFGSTNVGSTGTLLLSNLEDPATSNGSGFAIAGLQDEADNALSIEVSTAGDMNGDGFGDLVISSPLANDREGLSYVVFGGTSLNTGGTLDLTDLDSTQGFVIEETPGSENLTGVSNSQAGDVNNDGVDDLVLGAIGFQEFPSISNIEGKAYIIFGNIAPELEFSGSSNLVYEGEPVELFSGDVLSLSDANSATLSAATVKIDNLLDGVDEGLSATVTGTTITAAYDDMTGTLSLTGVAAIATYQQVLQSITYSNTAAAPNTDARTLIVEVDDGGAHSNISDELEITLQYQLPDDPDTPDEPDDSDTPDNPDSNPPGDNLDVIVGTPGNDQLTGDNGNNTLLGKAGNDRLSGRAGNDLLIGRSGNDRMRGGPGDDTLIANRGNDTLNGESGDDLLNGGAGDDKLKGKRGNDQLQGKGGDDKLKGGAGDDILEGNRGSDIMTGGSGVDEFVLAKGAGRDVIRDFADGVDVITLPNNLAFSNLTLVQQGNKTLISRGSDDLAILRGVQVEQITAADFT